ncbi:MAG: TraR/DksA family transcriptional regulator [bacterium]
MAKTMKKINAYKKDFLEKIKKDLLAEKARLENDLEQFAKRDPDAPGGFTSTFPNYGDKDDENAAEVADYQVRLSMENNLEKALRDVNQSLARLEKNLYGICKYCKKPIEEKRLLARPHSSACMGCKKAIKQEI